MLDIAVAYNKYKFLGNEFLTWLWYVIETDISLGELTQIKDRLISIKIGNSIVLENSMGDDTKEKISIKGDDAGLEEGTMALKKGGVVTEMNLNLKIDEAEYRFTIKGESMNITGLKVPASGKIEGPDEVEGAVLEKVFLCNTVFEIIDALYSAYIKRRISDTWTSGDLSAMRDWVQL
jgi:hypothetical protein